MDCSGRKTSEGKEELGAVVTDFEPGGGRSEGVRDFFQGSDPVGVIIWGGDVDTNP